MEACSLLVNLRKGMQGSSEQPLVGEEHYGTTLITAAKETTQRMAEQQITEYLIEFALTSQGKQINITPTTNQRQILRSQHTHDLII